MTFTTRLDHDQRLTIVHWMTRLDREGLIQNLRMFRAPDFPAHYDLIHLFEPDIQIEIDHTAVVEHAIERHRTLLERGITRQLQSAYVAVPDQLMSWVEIWRHFFPNEDKNLLIQMFGSLEEALVWLGREPLDEDALEVFPANHW